MPHTKCTMLMQLRTNVDQPNSPISRIGGWSESWYDTNTAISAVRPPFIQLCQKRAALLPAGAAVVGQRYQQVDPVGASSSTSFSFPGNARFTTSSDVLAADMPQNALLCAVIGASVKNTRRFTLRGLPDAVVVGGEYNPGNSAFSTALQAFFNELDLYWFPGRDLSAPTYPLLTIDSLGNFASEQATLFVVNQMVRVLRTKDADGRLRGGRFQVETMNPGGYTGKLAGWTFGACKGGKLRADSMIWAQVRPANISIGRQVTRKVGRPFTQYRGRRSAKR
jgi:hypothetical protein